MSNQMLNVMVNILNVVLIAALVVTAMIAQTHSISKLEIATS